MTSLNSILASIRKHSHLPGGGRAQQLERTTLDLNTETAAQALLACLPRSLKDEACFDLALRENNLAHARYAGPTRYGRGQRYLTFGSELDGSRSRTDRRPSYAVQARQALAKAGVPFTVVELRTRILLDGVSKPLPSAAARRTTSELALYLPPENEFDIPQDIRHALASSIGRVTGRLVKNEELRGLDLSAIQVALHGTQFHAWASISFDPADLEDVRKRLQGGSQEWVDRVSHRRMDLEWDEDRLLVHAGPRPRGDAGSDFTPGAKPRIGP